MRCNAWRWLWGLIPLAIVWWIGILGEHERIEADLKRRTEAALVVNKAVGTVSSFSGRDATLTGSAADEKERLDAAAIAAQVWGVRVVDNRSSLSDRPASYVWSAARGAKGIELGGFVPSEAARQVVLAAVREGFKGQPIDDRMRVAPGVDNVERWRGGMIHGLTQLVRLKSGHVELVDGGLLVAGEATTPGTYRDIKWALTKSMPPGVVLKSDKVTPPPVAPYTWSALYKGGKLELGGYAPSDRQRELLVAHAIASIPKADFQTRMEVAAGEPRGWQGATNTAMSYLARMIEGRAELTNQELRVTGLVDQVAKVEQIRSGLANDLPNGIKLTAVIDADPQMVAAEVKRSADAAAAAERQRAAAEEAERQKAAAEAAARKKAAADAAARQKAAVEDAERQKAAAEAEAEAARRRAADEAARQAEAARLKAEADEAARRSAAEAAARKAALDDDARKKAAAAAAAAPKPEVREAMDRCQTLLNSAMKQGTINFMRASADITAQSHPTLNELARIASECPRFEIDIIGHTDSEGTPERNQRLSERRAAAVVNYLAEAGVEQERLFAIGFGQSQPVAPNDTAENRARNRRIEFIVRSK